MAVMKRVSDDAMSIHVCENENYKQSLQRGDGKAVRFFAVVVCTPLGMSTVHVLAPDEDGAISQALCDSKFNITDENVYATAYRQPLRIRGWGHTEF